MRKPASPLPVAAKPATPPPFTGEALRAWVAPLDWQAYVERELGPAAQRFGRLFWLPKGPDSAAAALPVSHWAQNTWLEPLLIPYRSISDAQKQLRAIQRNWWPHVETLHRRSALIQEGLPHIGAKPRPFPFELPSGDMGAWCLLDEERLIASPRCSSPFPGGEISFVENRTDPPSSAYLKLWEALTRLGERPGPGQRCLDAGACPGGWTWVLEGLGAEVLALDRSPLDPRLMASPRVRFRSGNAFAVTPRNLADQGWERLDWLCSDLICYPEKLYAWVREWFDSGLVGRFVITIKMQGEADWRATADFAALPGGMVYHACHNKHELTWVWPAPQLPGAAGRDGTR